jgi:hypothetical protein
MPKRIELPIAQGFYKDASLPISAQDCINWIPQFSQAQGETLAQVSLIPTPGKIGCVAALDPGYIQGNNRGMLLADNVLYAVIGTGLYSLIPIGESKYSASIFTQKLLGTLPDGDLVSMATNGTWIVIVIPNGRAFAYNSETSVFAEITDANYYPSNCVVFKDGYFVFTESTGTFFFNSEINNPIVIEALSEATAEIAPDYIYGAIVSRNELFILGEQSIEVFQTNQSGEGSPFTRIPGGFIEKGAHCVFGNVLFDNTFVFIGGGAAEKTSIWKVISTASAVKISTPPVDNIIQQFTRKEIENSVALAYSDDTGTFAVFTFVSSTPGKPSVTFCYDAAASAASGRQIWHQRQTGLEPNLWNASSIVQAYGTIYVGAYPGEQLPGLGIPVYVLDVNTYTDSDSPVTPTDGKGYNPIYRQRTSQPFSNQGKSLFIGDIELTMQPGTGLQKPPFPSTSSQWTNPTIRMQYSDDGGNTFNNRSELSIGGIGQYNLRQIWPRNGRVTRYRCYRFITTAPVNTTIIKLEAWAEGGIQ